MWTIGSVIALIGIVATIIGLRGVLGGDDGKNDSLGEMPATTLADPTAQATDTSVAGPLTVAENDARSFSGSNTDWEPFVGEFGGVAMVLVPAGCFEMGSESGAIGERPVHRVCFEEPFWIDRTEVTNELYGSEGYFLGNDRPRENITWTDAQTFCERRHARLPTEAEWEFAARGPDAWVYPWGNEFDATIVVWDQYGTSPVGSKPAGASWVGALDMSGNVWEWVADWYASDYYAELEEGVVNPQGPTTGEYRVLRGGSWGINMYFLRSAHRYLRAPFDSFYGFGFRCARPSGQ